MRQKDIEGLVNGYRRPVSKYLMVQIHPAIPILWDGSSVEEQWL